MRTIKTAILLILTFATFQLNAQKKWSLQECIDYAKENSISIKLSENNIRQRESDIISAKDSRLPSASAEITQQWTFGRNASPIDNSFQTTHNSYTPFSLATSVPLFSGMKLHHTIKAAQLRLDASYKEHDWTSMETELAVIEAYLQALYDEDIAEICRLQVKQSEQQLQRISTMNQFGKVSEGDVFQMQSQLANEKKELAKAENNQKMSILTLSQLLELDSPIGFEIRKIEEDTLSTFFLANPSFQFDEIIKNNPLICAEEIYLQALKKDTDIARSNRFPRLTFNTAYGNNYYYVSGYDNLPFFAQLEKNGNLYFGFNLSIPIFQQFSVRNSINAINIKMDAQNLNIERKKRDLYKTLQQTFYEAEAATELYDYTLTAKEMAQKVYDQIAIKFENGKATQYELNEAKFNFMKAAVELSRIKYQRVFKIKILDVYNRIAN